MELLKMGVFAVLVLFFSCFTLTNGQACFLTVGDPCDTDLELTDWHRSVLYTSPDSNYINDYTLSHGWYRFKTEGDRTNITMPVSSPGQYHCGTKYPIWIAGIYPGISDGITTALSCVDDGVTPCKFQQTICIKACNSTDGEYFVHFLYASRGSNMAYCTDTLLPCQNGTNSATGFPPCNDNYPILDGKPTLKFQVESTGMSAVCDYKSDKYAWNGMDFLVKWFINNDLAYEKVYYQPDGSGVTAAISDECYCADCSEPSQCILNKRLNSNIQCEVRARFRNTGYDEFPPGLKSNIIHAGLRVEPNNTVYISENDDGQEFNITSTFPIVLRDANSKDTPRVDIYVGTRGPEMLSEKACFKSVTNESPATFNIIATRDDVNDGDDVAYLQFKGEPTTFSVEASRIWEGQENSLPLVKVISKDVPSDTICRTTGDPHITTFDKWYYHLYAPGDFLLYNHKFLPIKVQARLAPCNGVTCNCGVAVQVGDTHLFIDRCSNADNHHVTYKTTQNGEVEAVVTQTGTRVTTAELLKDGKRTPGTNIKYINGEYQIRLPTGSILKAVPFGNGYINVYITASSDDFDKIEGLCGNFDGNSVNDVEYRNGIVDYDCVPADKCSKVTYDTSAPSAFYNIWSVKDEENIFLGKLNLGRPYEIRRYCSCDVDANIQCDFCNGLTDGQSLECTDDDERRKRAADDQIDPDDQVGNYEFGPLIYDPNFEILVPEFPTKSGLTEEYTRGLCNDTILNSATYSLCLNAINNGSVTIDDIIEGCVVDVKVFDDVSIVKETLSDLQLRCKVVLAKDPKYWEVSENGTMVPPTDILDQMCMNECNGMGECVNGTCECSEGLGGSDCSVSLVKPPLVFAVLGDGVCDVRARPCKSAKVYGANFLERENITCHIQYVNVSDDGIALLPERQVFRGIYRTPEEVKCPLPEPAVQPNSPGEGTVSSGYLLSISNDGELVSESMAIMILYDSVCQVCNASAGKCSFRDNSCNINGHCFAASETNPQDVCQQCLPDQSVYGWSEKEVGCLSVPGTTNNPNTTIIENTVITLGTTSTQTTSGNPSTTSTTATPSTSTTGTPSTSTTGTPSTSTTGTLSTSTTSAQTTSGNPSTTSTTATPSTSTTGTPSTSTTGTPSTSTTGTPSTSTTGTLSTSTTSAQSTTSTENTTDTKNTTNSPSTTGIRETTEGNDKELSQSYIGLIVGCCVAVSILLTGLIVVFCKRSNNKGRVSPEIPVHSQNEADTEETIT